MASFNQSVDENKQNGKRKWNDTHTDIDRNSKEDEDDIITTGKLAVLRFYFAKTFSVTKV